MNKNPLAWLSGLARTRKQPIVCTSSLAGKLPVYDQYAPGGYLLNTRSGLYSTGALLGRLDAIRGKHPEAAEDVALLSAVITDLSVHQQFNIERATNFLTNGHIEALNRVGILAKSLPATNSVRKPITNLNLHLQNGDSIDVLTSEAMPAVGDQVIQNGQPAPDGKYVVGAYGSILTVKSGRITKIEIPTDPIVRNTAQEIDALKKSLTEQSKKNQRQHDQILAMLKNVAPSAKPANPRNALAQAVDKMKTNPGGNSTRQSTS